MSDPWKLIESTIDATFMQRGFNPKRHVEALQKALNEAGFRIVPFDKGKTEEKSNER